MKVKGTEKIKDFRAKVLLEMYGTTIAQGKKLKLGEEIDIATDKAQALINNGMAEAVSKVTTAKSKGGE